MLLKLDRKIEIQPRVFKHEVHLQFLVKTSLLHYQKEPAHDLTGFVTPFKSTLGYMETV